MNNSEIFPLICEIHSILKKECCTEKGTLQKIVIRFRTGVLFNLIPEDHSGGLWGVFLLPDIH